MLNIYDSALTNNVLSGFYSNGGGIYVYGSGKLTVRDSLFDGNQADYSGGGIYLRASTQAGIDAEITGSTFTNNSAQFGSGGGIFHSGNGTLTITDSVFSGNSADFRGGGVYNANGSTVITGSLLEGNDADSGGGFEQNAGLAEIRDSSIVGNTASTGGGILVGSFASLDLTNVTVAHNAAANRGGGLTLSGNAVITNSTFTGNRNDSMNPVYSGGAIWHRLGTVDLIDSVVTGNSAAQGENEILSSSYGAGATLNVTNSVLGTALVDGATTTSLGADQASVAALVFAETVGFVDANANGTQDMGEVSLDRGILAGRVAGNGGPVPTVALLADAANPALDASVGNETPDMDARGVAAFDLGGIDNGGTRDLGAYELDEQIPIEDPSLIVTTTLDVVDQFDGLTSLREAVTFANGDGVASEITFDDSVFTGGAANLIRLTEGQIVITQALTINGADVGGVTITGDRLDNDAVVAGTDITDVSASLDGQDLLADNSRLFLLGGFADAEATFDSLTLTGGRTTVSDERGGAIRSDLADVTLTNSTVSGNSTAGFGAVGGGISANTAVLTNSTVSGNSTAGANAVGGGISAGTAVLTNSTVSGNSTAGVNASGGGISANTATLTNSTVSGNSTAGYYAVGGGINALNATLTDSTVSGNSTTGYYSLGGGISANTAVLTNSTVSGNSTAGANAVGGGISAGTAVLTNSTVSGNSTTGDEARGGGINSGTATLTNSTVSGNSTAGVNASGGGIAASSVTLTNSTISGNSTAGVEAYGGGIRAVTATLTNSTISGNSTTGYFADGGGIWASRATLTNSLVIGNVSARPRMTRSGPWARSPCKAATSSAIPSR